MANSEIIGCPPPPPPHKINSGNVCWEYIFTKQIGCLPKGEQPNVCHFTMYAIQQLTCSCIKRSLSQKRVPAKVLVCTFLRQLTFWNSYYTWHLFFCFRMTSLPLISLENVVTRTSWRYCTCSLLPRLVMTRSSTSSRRTCWRREGQREM